MRESTSQIETRGGLRLFVRQWEPTGTPKAVIALVHGQGEHTGRYQGVADNLTNAGFVLIGFDLRGHGESGGPRGHSPSYEVLMDDIEDFLSYVSGLFPGLPLVLYGHSLGGGLVINFALRRKPALRGVVATGPWLKLAFAPPRLQVALARVFNRIFPAMIQSSGLDQSALSRDEKVVEAYAKDPFVHDKLSVRHFFGVFQAGLWALDHAAEWSLPLLLMHGTGDKITSQTASREFAERAGNTVKFVPWEGLYHEIHNEPEKAEVIRTITRWIAEVVGD